MDLTDIGPNSTEGAFTLDKAEILERLDGDWQLLAELCDMALAEVPRMLNPLSVAIAQRDAQGIHRAAHRLKGALVLFGRGPHIEEAETLEQMGRNQDLEQAAEVFSDLLNDLDELTAAVEVLGKEAHARAGC
jgi:HPt (histidine-containing phosphotransfer) domain-containing protein